ncbi:L,D-transpeptidase [Saccharomonospora iraqiensis]|uniref:L,D-transpeptidase n=1 Tax=Saccharomonospora iraqiensis TaxID=52698 RepID=UPI0009FEF100|nr:Ig-like domain-containing protein [Saccharomonospora iraqiensis]
MTESASAPARGTPKAVLALLLATLLGVGACTGAQGGGGSAQADDTAGPEPAVPAQVTVTPEAGSENVAPRDEVSVTVTGGTIASVALTNPEGEEVEGELAGDRTTWSVTEPLGYDKTYTFSGEASGADGAPVPIEGSFTTATPEATVGVSSNVGDGRTYGVAMPIALNFDAPVENRAAVERALQVETTPDIEGSWAWLYGGRSVHWRPKEYWEPGTEVSVSANVYGVRTGEGTYGGNDLTVDFSIGRSQIVKANTQTHRMEVFRDGEKVAEYRASFGLESDPGRVTRSGVHVVMAKHDKYFMNNPGYGYEDFEVDWAVRISNNGEFAHSAPWSVADQGERNVSHGCINLAPDNAKEYYDSAMIGDPFEIEGSSQPLRQSRTDYYDWTIPWDEWTTLSALND